MLRKRSTSRHLRFWQIAFVAIALPWCDATNALAQTGLSALSSQRETSTTEAATAPSVATLKKQQDELALRRRRVQQALDAASSNALSDVDLESLRTELEVLKFYELACAQHAEELTRSSELQQEQKLWQERLHELRLVGPEEPKPYSILLLDDIQDQLEAEKSHLQAITIELGAARDLQETTRRMHREAEVKRRQTKEALESASDEDTRQRIARQLEICELQSQLFADMGQLRRSEIANSELDRQLSELQNSYLQEKHKIVAANVVFTKDQLATISAELDKYEVDLREGLTTLQSRLQEIETRAYDAEQLRTEQRSDKQLRTEMEAGWKTARRSYQRQIKMLQQRLRELAVARLEWNIRYRIFNQLATREELANWEKDAELYLERIRASRGALEDESKALLVELGRLEKHLRITRGSKPEAAKWVEYQVASMRELSQAYANNLVKVETVERMLSKLNNALAKDLAPEDASDWLNAARGNLQAAWNLEITSVDDRPITVGKVVAGLLLMLLGIYASRRLSRLIGRRMLPRLGLANGAATAVQSISFYLMITCFGFISLELTNVPLTVFTFLGGAVAIGVGFGSQNIINNFISGLILLAEQPIRVGDLVDIGGLSGNVEKIGARSTRVKTGANLEIIVPNSKFLEDNVTNWTLSDTRMRTVVKVGVAYGSPTERVAAILKQAVDECPLALPEPEPIILFNDFGDNSLNFEVHFWIYVRTMMQARKIESDLRYVIDALLRAADISIAFPQRDVHLDTVKPIEVNIRQLAQENGLAVRRTDAA